MPSGSLPLNTLINPPWFFFRAQTQDIFSYRSLLDDAMRLGEYLKSQGLSPQDKVLFLMDSRPAFVQAFLAVMYAGAIAVPLDAQYSLEQVHAIVDHCQAKMILLTKHVQKSVQVFDSPVPVYTVDDEDFHSEWRRQETPGRLPEASSSDDTAMLFYTSGTTAQPKGVMLTHANLLSDVQAIYALNIVQPPDVFLSILPLHHAYAFTSTLLVPLLCGARVVYPAGINSMELAKELHEKHPGNHSGRGSAGFRLAGEVGEPAHPQSAFLRRDRLCGFCLLCRRPCGG